MAPWPCSDKFVVESRLGRAIAARIEAMTARASVAGEGTSLELVNVDNEAIHRLECLMIIDFAGEVCLGDEGFCFVPQTQSDVVFWSME